MIHWLYITFFFITVLVTLSKTQDTIHLMVQTYNKTSNSCCNSLHDFIGTKFLLLGDWGQKGKYEQTSVAQQLGLTASWIDAKFVISLGDNFYDNGVESVKSNDWALSWYNIYTNPSLTSIPWYAVLGNHDYESNPQAQIDFHSVDRRWHMDYRYYSRVYSYDGNSFGIAYIDTNPFEPLNWNHPKIALNMEKFGTDPNRQASWLADVLDSFEDQRVQWKFVIGHHPVYTGGPSHHNTDMLIDLVEPLLQRYNAIYISGHDHTMQHIHRNDLDFFVNGVGSCPEDYPAKIDGTKFRSNETGFMVIALNQSMIDLQFINSYGDILYEIQRYK